MTREAGLAQASAWEEHVRLTEDMDVFTAIHYQKEIVEVYAQLANTYAEFDDCSLLVSAREYLSALFEKARKPQEADQQMQLAIEDCKKLLQVAASERAQVLLAMTYYRYSCFLQRTNEYSEAKLSICRSMSCFQQLTETQYDPEFSWEWFIRCRIQLAGIYLHEEQLSPSISNLEAAIECGKIQKARLKTDALDGTLAHCQSLLTCLQRMKDTINGEEL